MSKSTYEIQDPSSGAWTPYTGSGSGNIRNNGTVYSNYAGAAAYGNEAADPAPAATTPDATNPIPTNPDGSQVGGGTAWDPGSSAPSSAPPGYHWNADMASFEPDASPPPGDTTAPPARDTSTAPPATTTTPPAVAPPATPSGSSSYTPPAASAPPAVTGPTTQAPATTVAATTQTPEQTAFAKTIRDALTAALGQGPVSANDPDVAPAIAANRVATERALQEQRDAIAERLNAQGMGGSGALDQQMAQAFEKSGTQQGLFAGNAVFQEGLARRQQLVSLLQTGAGVLNADDAQALQAKIADLDAYLRQQSITNQNNQANDSMGLTGAYYQALLQQMANNNLMGG